MCADTRQQTVSYCCRRLHAARLILLTVAMLRQFVSRFDAVTLLVLILSSSGKYRTLIRCPAGVCSDANLNSYVRQ